MNKAIPVMIIMASCVEARIAPRPLAPWCLSGMDLPRDIEWASLPENAATIVRPERIGPLLRRLQERAFVEISRAEAEEAAGALPPYGSGHYYLVRGGVVGGTAVTVEQYVRNAGSAIQARASMDPEAGLLLVMTFQMSSAMNYRNVPIVVWTSSRVTRAVAQCLAAA